MQGDPKKMQSKFDSVCKGCGAKIKKGDWIYYWPRTKTVKCSCGEKDFATSMELIQDEDLFNNCAM